MDLENFIIVFNFKMSDIAASYILAHIKSLNLKKHIDIQQHFIDNVLTVPNVELFNYQPTIVYNNLPILFESITEDVFLKLEYLWENITTH